MFDGHVHVVDRVFITAAISANGCPTDSSTCRARGEGGLDAMFFSIFVTEDYYPARYETKQTLRHDGHGADADREEQGRRSSWRWNADDIERIDKAGKMAAVLDVEGSVDLDGDLGVIRDMYRLGCARCSSPRITGPTTMPILAARRPSGMD